MENNMENSMSNPLSQPSSPLPTKIKQIIQTHYSSLSKKEVNEKVRTQVIPILITLFFDNQNTNQQNIIRALNSIQVGVDTATYVGVGADGSLGSFKNILMENCNVGNLGVGEERQRGYGGKEDWDKQGMYISRFDARRNRKLDSSHTDSINKQNQQRIRIFLQKNKQLSAQCLVEKTISVFKLCTAVGKAQVIKQHMHELFSIYKRGKKYRIKQLRWFQQFLHRQRILTAINMFYKNMNKQKNCNQGQQQCMEFQKAKINAQQQKLKRIVISRFIYVLQAKRLIILGEIMQKLCWIGANDRKNRINKWMTKFVRAFVYSTPANLQTSLWRLINFGNKQNKNRISNQHQDKKQKQQLRLCQQEVLPETKQVQNKVDQRESMNTKKQKTNIQSSCQQVRSFSMIRCESKQLNRTQSNNLSENIFQKHTGDDGALHPAGFQVASLSNCLSLPCIEDEVKIKINEQKEEARQNGCSVEEHQQLIEEIVRNQVEEIIGDYFTQTKLQ